MKRLNHEPLPQKPMSAETRSESLTRLAAGELNPLAAYWLRQRIARDASLRREWEATAALWRELGALHSAPAPARPIWPNRFSAPANTPATRLRLPWQWGALATVAAVVWGGVAYNRHLNAAPTFAIPAPAPLPRPNAYDDFLRAAALHREPASSHGVLPTAAQVDAVSAENAAALRALRVGFTHTFQMPAARSFKDWGKGYKHLSAFRSLARTLRYEARQRAARGDAAGAMDESLDGLQMGVMMTRGGATTNFFVAVACDAVARKPMWGLIERLDAGQAAHAAQRLEAINALRTPFVETLREEKWGNLTDDLELLRSQSVMAAFTQVTQPPDTSGDGDQPTPRASDAKRDAARILHDQFALAFLSKQRIIDDEAAWMDAQIARANLPYNAAALPPLPPLDAFNQAVEVKELYRHAQFADTSERTDDGLLTVALALRACRLRTGSYPSSLGSLVSAGLLHAVPADPFAPKDGTPFGYRVLGGDRYQLYSVGPDGIDNGGHPIDLTHFANGIASPTRAVLDASDRGDWVGGVNLPLADTPAAPTKAK